MIGALAKGLLTFKLFRLSSCLILARFLCPQQQPYFTFLASCRCLLFDNTVTDFMSVLRKTQKSWGFHLVCFRMFESCGDCTVLLWIVFPEGTIAWVFEQDVNSWSFGRLVWQVWRLLVKNRWPTSRLLRSRPRLTSCSVSLSTPFTAIRRFSWESSFPMPLMWVSSLFVSCFSLLSSCLHPYCLEGGG